MYAYIYTVFAASKSLPTLKSQSVSTNQSSAAIITLNNTLQQCLEGTAGEFHFLFTIFDLKYWDKVKRWK